MTNTPGEDQPSQDPSNAPTPDQQPGYWQQQAQQQGQQPGQQPGYPQPGYPPPGYAAGYAPQPPTQYAPEHPKATTSLVLGILGVVLCQVLAPFAWVVGKRTVDEIDASGGRVGGRGSAQAGYVLGIVGTVLLGLGVLYILFMMVIFGGAMLSSSSG